MKYCPHCHRINYGRPQICNYCGRSWYFRLCPRGHENSYDASFCGTCGSTDLTDTAGYKPWWTYLIKIIILGCIVLCIYSLVRGMKELSPLVINYLVCIATLLFGYYLVIAIAPKPLKGMLIYINKVIGNVLIGCLSWLGELLRAIIFESKKQK